MIPFISADDLSAYIGQTVSDTDLVVMIALDAACQVVRDAIGRTVNLNLDEEIVLDGTGTSTLVVPQRPITEVSSVELDGVTLTTDEYVVDNPAGLIRLVQGAWTLGLANVALTYSHGWALSEDAVTETVDRVPSSLRLVALRLAAAIWRTHTVSTGAGGVRSETIGSFSYTLDDTTAQLTAATHLTTEDRATLGAWRDARVA